MKTRLFFTVFMLLLQGGLTESPAVAWSQKGIDAAVPCPKDAIQHYHEGMARQMAMDFNGAAEEYKAAVAIDPNMLEAWSILGMVYHAQGKLIQEKEALERAKQLSQTKAAEMDRRAEELLSENKIAEATDLWQKAKNLDPELDLASAHHRLECITGAMANW